MAWTVTFSEAVTGVGVADFGLAVSGLSSTSITGVSVVNATTYTVAANTGGTGVTGTLGLNLVDDDSITDTTANKLGGLGTGNGNVTGETYAVDKLGPGIPSLVVVTSAIVPSSTPACIANVRYISNAIKAGVVVTATIEATRKPGRPSCSPPPPLDRARSPRRSPRREHRSRRRSTSAQGCSSTESSR